MNWAIILVWRTVLLKGWMEDVARMDRWVEEQVRGRHAVQWILEECILNIPIIGV